MSDLQLAGRTILVVEDEYYAATDLAREFRGAGARVIGPAPTVEMALELIASADRIDGALLDVNLGGEMVFPAADRLRERDVPFLFATGYDRSMIPSRFDDVVRCEKPVAPEKVRRMLASVLRRCL